MDVAGRGSAVLVGSTGTEAAGWGVSRGGSNVAVACRAVVAVGGTAGGAAVSGLSPAQLAIAIPRIIMAVVALRGVNPTFSQLKPWPSAGYRLRRCQCSLGAIWVRSPFEWVKSSIRRLNFRLSSNMGKWSVSSRET